MPDPRHDRSAGREAVVTVDTGHPLGRVSDDIYGQFLESSFFGNIEGGVFDEGSPLAVDDGPLRGVRADVLELSRDLAPGPIRWPGGNFASAYHWEDGIGPRDERPTRPSLIWGGQETNRFGTDEFLAWCEAVGAEPYLVHSARDVDEALRWIEYTNATADTALTRRRAANGRAEPWRVRYWGIGNEVYGAWQRGHRPAAQYAADLLEHARFMRRVDPDIRLIGVGSPHHLEEWNGAVLSQAGRHLDYLSFHLYGSSSALWTGDDYDAVVAQPLYFEERLTTFSELVTELSARAGLDRPPALTMDEWTVRHFEPASWPDPLPGDDGGIADRPTPVVAGSARSWPVRLRVNRWSPRTIADAVFCAGVFHAIHRTAGLAAPVAMANPVNMVNANGLIVARPKAAFGSALYHVYRLYRQHTGRTVLPSEVDGPARTMAVRKGISFGPDHQPLTAPMTVPYVDACATRAEDGSVCLAVVNRHRSEAIAVRPVFDAAAERTPTRARVRQVGADIDDLGAANSVSQPDAIGIRDLGEVAAVSGRWTVPPHSITVFSLDVERTTPR